MRNAPVAETVPVGVFVGSATRDAANSEAFPPGDLGGLVAAADVSELPCLQLRKRER